MLQGKDLQKLLDILSLKEQSLEEIQGSFLSAFSQSLAVFKASYVLSNLINLNLLTNQQRIVALFLLIENFKSEGIKKHPFGATILSTSQKTTEPYERKLIADLVIDSKRQKYSKLKIETLHDEQQVMIEMSEQRPEIKKLRDEFIAALPKISQSKKSEVYNVVPDFNQKDKKCYPPEFEVNRSTIKEQETSNDCFNIGFMRPIPTFIEISPSEFNWLSPGLISDVHWDNTAEIEKKLTKSRTYIKKGLQNHLTKEEATEIDRSLQTQPYAVLSLDLTPQNLNSLIKNNPFVAVSFLVKLSNYPIVGEYLQSIIDSPVSLNSIDVISRLTKASRLPNQFLETYTLKNMKQVQSIPQNHKDRSKIPRVLANFIKSLMKNKLLDLTKYWEEVEQFTNVFIEIEEVQTLKKVLKQE